MYYCTEIEYVTIPCLHSEGRCILEILQYWVLYNHHCGSSVEPNIFFSQTSVYYKYVFLLRSPIKIKTIEIYQLMSFTMQLKLSPTPNTQWGPGTRTPPHWDIKSVEFLAVSNKLWWSAPLQQLQQLQPTSNLMTRMQNMRLQNKLKVVAAFICLPISASPMHPNIFGKTSQTIHFDIQQQQYKI